MDTEEKTQLVFVCPKCGDHKFGTSNVIEPLDKWIGHCHNDHVYCKFTWSRKDDWKYFQLVYTKTKTFETPEEYRQYVQAIKGRTSE